MTAQLPDRLVPGIYEFGRSILKFQDMRVSKTQVRLDVWPDHVSVTRVRLLSFSCPLFRPVADFVCQFSERKEPVLYCQI